MIDIDSHDQIIFKIMCSYGSIILFASNIRSITQTNAVIISLTCGDISFLVFLRCFEILDAVHVKNTI